MQADAALSQAATIEEWALQWQQEHYSTPGLGAEEVAFLLRRAAHVIRGFTKGDPVKPTVRSFSDDDNHVEPAPPVTLSAVAFVGGADSGEGVLREG